jgi:D-arabinose 1-dehydrogenase-like Zn-dependent alcohol dehydrogenase
LTTTEGIALFWAAETAALMAVNCAEPSMATVTAVDETRTEELVEMITEDDEVEEAEEAEEAVKVKDVDALVESEVEPWQATMPARLATPESRYKRIAEGLTRKEEERVNWVVNDTTVPVRGRVPILRLSQD